MTQVLLRQEGDHYSVDLPVELIERLHLSAGQPLALSVQGDHLVIEAEKSAKPDWQALQEATLEQYSETFKRLADA